MPQTRDRTRDHVETFVNPGTGARIRASCDCAIGRDHLHSVPVRSEAPSSDA